MGATMTQRGERGLTAVGVVGLTPPGGPNVLSSCHATVHGDCFQTSGKAIRRYRPGGKIGRKLVVRWRGHAGREEALGCMAMALMAVVVRCSGFVVRCVLCVGSTSRYGTHMRATIPV